MTRFLSIFLGCYILVTGCKESSPSSYYVNVEYAGALKNFMKEGDISAKIDLSIFKGKEHFYGLGAIENLKGEIQIFNGSPYNTYVSNDTMAIDTSFNGKAALLVYATVRKWNTLNIPDDVKNISQLEAFIASTASGQGLASDKPFPFQIMGQPEKVDWHVINWKEDDMVHTHEKHMASGLQGTLKDAHVAMLGFYSENHKGIFTHHTTPLHMHVKSESEGVAGHVDDLVLSNGMTLLLPAKERGEHFDSIISITGAVEYYRLMALSVDDFDQSWEGFRKYSDNYELVSLLIPEYLDVNNISGAQSRNLHWHMGQIHAFNGNYEAAIKEMKQSYEGGSTTWSAYVSGSIAFLERDKPALEEALKQLEAQENQMNIGILRAFVEHFDKSYAEAISLQ